MARKTLLLTLATLVSAMPMFATGFQAGDLFYNTTSDSTVEVIRDTINDYEKLTNVPVGGINSGHI